MMLMDLQHGYFVRVNFAVHHHCNNIQIKQKKNTLLNLLFFCCIQKKKDFYERQTDTDLDI